MPNILQRNNPKAEKFQQLLALAGLAQQQEQGQSSLQQQLAFHQASLQQQEADARQMQAWREMQGQQAATNENNRMGEFYSTTAPAEWVKLEALKSGQAQNHNDAVAALTQQQQAHEQMVKAQVLEHYSSLMPQQQDQARPYLTAAYPWFKEADQQRHLSEVENEFQRYAPTMNVPGITPQQRDMVLTGLSMKGVHPDVINRLKAAVPQTLVSTTPPAQHFGVSTDLAPPGVPAPRPATPLPGSIDYMYQQQQRTLPSAVPDLSRNQLESARAAQTRRLLEAANLTAN